MAFLAALPKAPNNYNPIKHPKAAHDRRNWVIGRMLEEGFISLIDAEKAKTAAYEAEKQKQDLIATIHTEIKSAQATQGYPPLPTAPPPAHKSENFKNS